MKALLIAINAKYIHSNLAIRLLKSNTSYQTDIKDFTIKDDISTIINFINNSDYNIIGFSCYIWNINMIKQILLNITNKTIVLGGPEVSYNAKYYIENNLAKYVIKNEGEEAFDKLLLHLDNKLDIKDVPNLYYEDKYTFDKIVDISNTNMAYDLLDDVENKIVYIETSRGCPYHCGYCMASLDNKLRFFDMEKIKKEILKLQQKKARVFKFLDRTFNANKKFLDLIDFIIENHKKGESYQFEITGDLLKSEYIEYINEKAPKNLIRFEIGIQSTNIKTNLSVGRIQDNKKLFKNIKLIQDKNIIDLHLDLIAGLPYEDYKSFENTFNEVVSLRPKELQLGFLKLLCGTALYNDKDKYNYIFSNEAPYEIIENDYMSKKDIENIHLAEDSFETYYNSNLMYKSMMIILDKELSPFDFFFNLGKTDYKGKNLENTFKHLDDYLINKSYYKSIHKQLIIDYLSYYNLKPKAWWNERLDKKNKNEILRILKENNNIEYDLQTLYKYSLLVNLDDCYILAIYLPNKKDIIIIKK